MIAGMPCGSASTTLANGAVAPMAPSSVRDLVAESVHSFSNWFDISDPGPNPTPADNDTHRYRDVGAPEQSDGQLSVDTQMPSTDQSNTGIAVESDYIVRNTFVHIPSQSGEENTEIRSTCSAPVDQSCQSHEVWAILWVVDPIRTWTGATSPLQSASRALGSMFLT